MTVVVAMVGLVCSLTAAPAAAAGPPVGFVRIAHLSPDGRHADVYVDGARTLAGVGGADVGMGGMARRGRLAPGGPSIPLAALLLAAATLWAARRRRV